MRRYKLFVVSLMALPLVFVLVLVCGSTSDALGSDESTADKSDSADLASMVSTAKENDKANDRSKYIVDYFAKKRKLNKALKSYFDKAVASGDIVGAGVSIVLGDSIAFSDGFGKLKSSGTRKVDGETLFRLGSLSKGFAGVLAADLKEEGKLHWTDRVRDFIPDFQLGDADNTNKITLAHILSHTSGTPYHSFTNLVDAGIPIKDIAKRFSEVNPISEPGAIYSYQNAMFSLCGEMMEKVTGNDISENLQTRFFNPLGMCSTTTDYEVLSNSVNVALPHVRARRGWRSSRLSDSYHNAIAAGGINASAHDMALWMRFLLGHNPEIMDKDALAEAFKPQIEVNLGNKYYHRWPGHLTSHYAFGWRIHEFARPKTLKKETVWHHGGSVNHFRNEIAVYPDSDMGICVLLNSNSRLARTVVPDLYKIVQKVYGEDVVSDGFAAME